MDYGISLDGIHPRLDFVAEKCEGRSVLDLGFASHPNTREQRAAGKLLHDRIVKVCDNYVGLDVDFEDELFMGDWNRKYLRGDCQSWADLALFRGLGPDVVVLAETLEHLGNPQTALEAIAGAVLCPESQLIVTVPNAFRHANELNGARGVESVGPEHVCWYSPQTLRRLLERSGLRVASMHAYGSHPWEARHLEMWGRPHWLRAPGIIAIAELPNLAAQPWFRHS